MKRCFVSLAAMIWFVSLAHGHFIWVVPETDGKAVRVFFSDNLTPDDAKLLAKIARTEMFVRDGTGKPEPVKWTQAKDVYRVEVPAGNQPNLVTAVCTYGVVQRGKSEPFLLNYNASAYLKPSHPTPSPAWDRLGLEVKGEPSKENRSLFRVLWEGKPLPNAEVLVLAPGDEKGKERKTDKDGLIDLGTADKPGLYGLRARHVLAKVGKHDGKDYKEVRHYSTLVFRAGPAKGAAAPAKADPAASKLLAEARAARATWKDFPGFTADVVVNFDGKVSKGKVHAGKEGKVRLEGIDPAFEIWTRRELASLVGHRLDSGTPRDTPCAFTDRVEDHPFGREIRVLNDELHSSYRIRGKEIVVVNRTMKDRRFTITVLQSIANAEGKLLTTSFVVDYWHLDTGELVRNDATSQTWTRVGKFDLPVLTRLVTATKEKTAGSDRKEEGYTAKSLTLSNHKLLGGSAK